MELERVGAEPGRSRRTRRPIAFLLLLPLLLPLASCKISKGGGGRGGPGVLTVLIPDFDSSLVLGLGFERIDTQAAQGSFEVSFSEPLPFGGLEFLPYQVVAPDGGVSWHQTPVNRNPADPDEVALDFSGLPFTSRASYRVRSFNAAGDSQPAAQLLEFF